MGRYHGFCPVDGRFPNRAGVGSILGTDYHRDVTDRSLSPTLVIGTGLIGAAVGCALNDTGVRVHLRDRTRSTAVVAAGRGAGMLDAPAAAEVRLVVVAVPPAAIGGVVAAALRKYPNAAVTDVGSVKAGIAAELTGLGAATERYLGGHPMAGSHRSGPLTANKELFLDRTWVLTPNPVNPPWVRQRVRLLVKLCGARLVELSATDHDRAVAALSHFPQLVSSLTAARLTQVAPEDLQLAGQGIRDVTRIAASDASMWGQIVAANVEPIRTQLMALRADLATLIDALDDADTVTDLLQRGNAGVRALPNRRGKRPEELASVVVEIPDAPGSLGALFTAITAAGVNIEDLSMEHDQIRDAGYLSIEVSPDGVAGLRRMIAANGWRLRS